MQGRALATNGDKVAQDNEIGPTSNNRFGITADQRADPDLRREYTWDYNASIQHQLTPHISVIGAWYQTRSYDTQRTINTFRSISNYASFQVPNPLLNGETITLYNYNLGPTEAGKNDTLVTNSDINHRDYVGYEVSVQTRWAKGGRAQAGWSTERTRSVTCDTPNPNQLRFCDQTSATYQELGVVPSMPFRQEFKLAGSQPLFWELLVGASFISYPGGLFTALLPVTGGPPVGNWPGLQNNWAVPAAVFTAAGMTRAEVVTTPLIAPGTQFLERWNQFDVSIRRRFHFGGRYEIQPALEVYNLMNSAVVLGQNQNFGATWGAPTSTLQGRLFKLSAILKF